MSIDRIHKRMLEKPIVEAHLFAEEAHKGQTRKFTQLPYINHCAAVAKTCAMWHQDDEVIQAAILHDVIEDTERNYDDILEKFGKDVADMVWDCTDPPNVRGDTRRRMKIEKIQALPVGSPSAFIQMADLSNNVSDLMYSFDHLGHGMKVFEEFGAGVGIVKYYEKKLFELIPKVMTSELGVLAYGFSYVVLGGMFDLLSKNNAIEQLDALPDPF